MGGGVFVFLKERGGGAEEGERDNPKQAVCYLLLQVYIVSIVA